MAADDIRKADESLRDFSGKSLKSACYAPFVSLYLTPFGSVQACCRNMIYILGNVGEERLSDIWKGKKLAALRKALTDYNFDLGCTYCEWEGQRRNDSFAIRLMSDQFPVASPEPEWPVLLEFNGSNTCNLECIQCSGDYSSAIRANRDGLPPMPKAYDDRFFEDLRPFLQHLQFINFLGGEPFLTTEAHRIWAMMIEDGLTIPCRVTTNGTQYNTRIERVLNAIPMHITVSLDALSKDTFEKIRQRANFETVIANVHRFRAYTRERGMNFGISYCLMRQNWREVADMVLFAEELDCELSILMVTGPPHCTLFTLPPEELRGIVREIEELGKALVPRLRRHRKAWEETVQHLRDATDANQLLTIQTTISADELATDEPLAVARRLADAGDGEKALQSLQKIREGQANHYHALALSGYIRGRHGDLKGATDDLESALQISGKLPDAYVHLARIQFHQGKIDEALKNVLRARERVVPEDRTEAQVLVLLGLIHLRQWRFLQAYRAFGRLVSLPQPSRDGVILPDSADGARRTLAEVQTGAAGFRVRCLAFGLRTLYRLAAVCRRFASRRKTVAAPPAGKAYTAGEAVRSLLGDIAEPKATWTLRVAGVNNKARLVFAGDSVRIDIAEAGSGITHDIQMNYTRLRFAARTPYRLKFRVRADQARTAVFGIAKAGAPWSNLGFYRTLEVNTCWQDVEEDFVSETEEDNSRLHFDLGESGAAFEVAALSVAEVEPAPNHFATTLGN